jgi:hypothetical protein
MGVGRPNLIVLLVMAVVILTFAMLWTCFVGGIFLLYYRS